ncbi:addiction module protein [Pseudidiomarina donghaiensis]|uniref:Addiction module protein n=1 Tax=Pseudidiomarina donghaiensis TaxID=519452 RepID=A0A432XI48_9GAMM|nr:addiction module protein [Pseudidiomarina donghaiensis]RUO48434.1 addiction module protein [Pseudidiomarina donghaiensis]SFV24139.1 putative addiction module component, TIGR02574 family [Pseudidiomarina donghaiensis]
MKIQDLTVSERINLAEALWDSVVAENVDLAITPNQITELTQRREAYKLDKNAGSAWEDVKSRILTQAE